MLAEDFEEKVNYLNSTLHDSMERLLGEAKKQGALLPPFGRPPTPTPFVDEDDEIVQDLDGNDEDTRNEDDVANFKYQYGFNPLVFLADFIHRAHPASISLRQKHQSDARSRLTTRAEHARNQLSTAEKLKVRAIQLRSGIIHGPLTCPLSPTSVMFFCRTVTAGSVVVELSPDPAFTSPYCASFPSRGPEDPVKEELLDLQPATKYYCRCHLQDSSSSADQSSPHDSDSSPVYFAQCQFWTLVDSTADSDADRHQELELFAINGQIRQHLEGGSSAPPPCFQVSEAASSTRPLFSVLVGDIFDNEAANVNVESKGDSPPPPLTVDAQLWQLFRRDPLFFPLTEGSAHNSVLSLSSMMCAWNDSQKGSDTGLKAEEIVHKQWSYDTRKFEKRQKEKIEKEKKEAFEQKGGGGGGASSVPAKKRTVPPPPGLSRPAMSIAFSKLAKELPLLCFEDNVRHLYRSVLVSPDVEVFVLDSRKGYLGKDQARWLKDSIRKSSAAMKIIFSGQTFGLHFVEHLAAGETQQASQTKNTETEHDDEESVEEETDDFAVTLDRTDSNEQEHGSAPGKTPPPPTKKVSSSRQRALEATKEEFDEDGLSKSSLAHVVVSTHRKLYPSGSAQGKEKDKQEDEQEDEHEDEQEDEDEQTPPRDTAGGAAGSKIELTGGILIVSSADTEESFAATYNFGRTSEELAAEDCFCLEVGLGRACRGGGGARKCEEKATLTAPEALVSQGRKLLYRSSTDGDQLNVNAISCSIVVEANGVLCVAMKHVDTGSVVFETKVISAL